MLWYKGWLETRFRLLFVLAMTVFLLILQHSTRGISPSAHSQAAVRTVLVLSNGIMILLATSMLAGAGIATQPSFQATKGLHGSTLFTLSLPVSRFHLLAVRAGLGWLEMAGSIGALCYGMW